MLECKGVKFDELKSLSFQSQTRNNIKQRILTQFSNKDKINQSFKKNQNNLKSKSKSNPLKNLLSKLIQLLINTTKPRDTSLRTHISL